MFRQKRHLFFDLDHTLWDYETSSAETLKEIWESYRLADKDVTLERFLQQFTEVNEALWNQLHAGEISKDVIRKERFPAILSRLSISDRKLATEIQEVYINECPTKAYLIDGAMDLLEHVSGRYKLHILTNGFGEIQDIKLRSGKIEHFFSEIITSELAGYQKPDKKIFDFALTKANVNAVDAVMIGDNPLSDIKGAQLAGIDQIFFNPDGQQCPVIPTLEIKSLRDLIVYF
jgi:YjjG family noncanonical pyrimidine nucleotidase